MASLDKAHGIVRRTRNAFDLLIDGAYEQVAELGLPEGDHNAALDLLIGHLKEEVESRLTTADLAAPPPDHPPPTFNGEILQGAVGLSVSLIIKGAIESAAFGPEMTEREYYLQVLLAVVRTVADYMEADPKEDVRRVASNLTFRLDQPD